MLPKPLLPVGDGPVLEVVINQLSAAGFERVTVATGYMAELIEVVLSHRKSDAVAIDYVRESEPLGTVGPLATIDNLDSSFLVMNGDVLTDLDYRCLLSDHIESDAVATIATTTRHLEVTLGVLECNDDSDADRLTGYVEKPKLTYQVSMGIYCFSPRVLEYIEPGVYLDLPELVLRLIDHGEMVRAWRSDAYWVDLGRREDYEKAITDFDGMLHRFLADRPAADLDLVR